MDKILIADADSRSYVERTGNLVYKCESAYQGLVFGWFICSRRRWKTVNQSICDKCNYFKVSECFK